MKTETTDQSNTLTTSLLTALALLLLVAGTYYWKKSWRLTKQSDQSELRADSLLSVKLRLEGDIRQLQTQLETATDNSTSLDKHVADLHHIVHKRTTEAYTFRQRSKSRGYTIQQLNHQLTGLTTQRDSLENQLTAMRDKIDWLGNENRLLIGQNEALQQKLQEREASLLTKVSRSVITGDAFRVEASKSNQKETAKAKKVHALTVSFDVPPALQLSGTHDLFLSLTDSQQNAMEAPRRTATVVLADLNELIPVHAVQRVDFDKNPQRISFRFLPETAIKPGQYRAAVFTKTAYLGSVEFQFRDSFLFF